MRRFGRTLLSALLPELRGAAEAGAKYLVQDVLSKDKDSERRIGGVNVNKLGRAIVGAGERIGKKLIEENIPNITKASELHEGKKQLMVYDPFRAKSVPAAKLKDIIDDPNTSEAEKQWAYRKKSTIKKKYSVQV